MKLVWNIVKQYCLVTINVGYFVATVFKWMVFSWRLWCSSLCWFVALCLIRGTVEGDVQCRKAALLRGTEPIKQAAHGKTPWLPVPTETQAHVHRGWQEDADLWVQDVDAAATQRDAAAVVSWRAGSLRHSRTRTQFWLPTGRFPLTLRHAQLYPQPLAKL